MNTETDTINPRNYSLCEAAPDLLAALEQIVTAADGQLDSPVYFEIHRVLINNARAAIAKAKGDK